MRRFLIVAALFTLVPMTLVAKNNSGFLSPFRNARFVYVTSYDGPQFSANLLPADREAISRVQDELQKWGHYTIVYHPQEADMIVAVQSWPSEDVLAVYDRQSWRSGTYLWRAMEKGGLTGPNSPLVQQLEAGLSKISGRPVG
jgi:hypothetical protein